jgi:hypothetical protein
MNLRSENLTWDQDQVYESWFINAIASASRATVIVLKLVLKLVLTAFLAEAFD